MHEYKCEKCAWKGRDPLDEGAMFCCPDCGDFVEAVYREPKWLIVAVYLCDKAYGGPEEGGWWYNTGHPVEKAISLLRRFKTRKQANEYRDRLDRALNICWNHGRADINSVLSQGQFRAIIHEESYPKAYPGIRPHYC